MAAARRTLAALVALAYPALGVSVASAAAEPSAIPAECGSRQAFDAELALRLRLDPEVGVDPRREGRTSSDQLSRVSVSITPQGDSYRLRVAIGGEQRELEDTSCTELFRAALVIAVSMLLGEDETSPQDVTPSRAATPASAAPLVSTRPRFSVGAGAGLAVGTLPKAVLALELEGKVLWRHLGVSASLRALLPAERRDPNRQGADLYALGAGVTGIFRPATDWEARLGFAVQRLSGKGFGLNQGYSASVWAAGPTLGLGWTPLRYGAFWAGVGAEGQLNVVRGRFEILNYSGELTGQRYPVYRVPWLSGDAFVRFGLVW